MSDQRENMRRILFDELFVDCRAQDYKDAATRLWTEQYQLRAELEAAHRHHLDAVKRWQEAETKLQSYEADAKRYRYLRDYKSDFWVSRVKSRDGQPLDWDTKVEDGLDAIVDEAISKLTQGFPLESREGQ